MDLNDQNRTYHQAQSSMEFLPNYFEWTYGLARRYVRGVMVELGCGAGLGIKTYLDKANEVFAVDYNDELLQRIEAREYQNKVTTIRADLVEEWSALESISAQTVVLMDVLEHFNDDQTFLFRAAKLLDSGGHLILKVPAQSSLYCNIDRASGHYRRYDTNDLIRLANFAGLEVVSVRHLNPLGAFFYKLKRDSQSNFSKTFSRTQLKLINILIPSIRIFDSIRFLKGLSIICVMRTK